jgi:L-threonylcarbamoyladenylate synthase
VLLHCWAWRRSDVLLAADDPSAVEQAADRLMRGELVAFPTETVYGLGARADDDAAVAHIYAAKGRPSEHPLIVHVADAKHAQVFAAQWPPVAQRLAAAFWPGPLTIVLPATPAIAPAVLAGGTTVAIRVPAHEIARALAQELGFPITSTSANRSGDAPAVTGADLSRLGRDDIDLLLDAGPCPGGLPSTMVEMDAHGPRLVRAGAVAWERVLRSLE